MKHYIVTAFILAASVFAGNNYGRAHVAEEKKQTFRITVLNTDGSPQNGMILKISGYGTEYTSNEEGLFEFEHEINEKNIRTGNFYFPDDKQKSVKSLRLDKAATDTIIRINSQEDLIRYKQSGKTFQISGIVKNCGRPIANAEISIQGTGRRASTDANGEFVIEADYNHVVMIRAEKMENKYLDADVFLEHSEKPYTINMIRKGADRIYASVEQMPQYPGGMKQFFNYVRRKAHTTELAEKTQTEGTVMIQFVVEKDGSITSPHIVRSLKAELDTAALDAIIVMRDWIPAKDHGTTVRCKYSVPVPFKLPKPKEPEKKPVLPKDSLLADSIAADSTHTDSLGLFAPIAAGDSLKLDSLQKKLALAKDSLFTDSLNVHQKNDSLQTDSLKAVQQPAAEVKPKKRNAFVRFFRWLFGIKDKEAKPQADVPGPEMTEEKEIPAAESTE